MAVDLSKVATALPQDMGDMQEPAEGADTAPADGAHTHPSYDAKIEELEQRISALEGGGQSGAENALKLPAPEAYGGGGSPFGGQ